MSQGAISILQSAFSGYIDGLVVKLASALDVEEDKIREVIQEYDNGIRVKKTENKKSSEVKKEVKVSEKEVKKDTKTEDNSEVKKTGKETCERLMKMRSGITKMCGATATNKHNNKFYCGTKEEGCLNKVLKLEKLTKKKVTFVEPEVKPVKAKGTLINKLNEDISAQIILHKKVIDSVEYRLCSTTGILYTNNGTKPIGWLNPETGKKEPLGKKQIAWLEKNNHPQGESDSDVSSGIEDIKCSSSE